MRVVSTLFSGALHYRPSGSVGNAVFFCLATLLGCLFAAGSFAAPVVLNQPFTAKPGDVVSLIGSGFGASPQVIFKARHQEAATPVAIIHASDKAVAFQVPPSQPFDIYDVAVSDGTASTSIP